jgi:hypothetical protein
VGFSASSNRQDNPFGRDSVRCRHRGPGRLAAGLLVFSVLLTILVVSGTAAAHVATVPIEPLGPTVTIGEQPRSTELLTFKAPVGTFDNAGGHPVMHSSVVYAIYWDPYYEYHGDWEHLINTFLQASGADSGSLAHVYSVDEQYTDKTNAPAAYRTTFRGAYRDTNLYPETNQCTDPDLVNGELHAGAALDNIACLTDSQLRTELQSFIAKNGLETGMSTIFYLFTPPGVTVCLDRGTTSGHCSDFTWQLKSLTEEEPNPESYKNSFCSYHATVTSAPVEGDAATILYAAVPWTAGGLADGHLFEQAPAFDCQDGGIDPTTKPKVEQPESPPHQQEPNQLPAGERGPDGTFDTGLADLIINQVAVEQQDTVTDPLLNGWQDAAGNEAVDECRNFFALTLGGESKIEENTEAGTLYNQTIAANHYYLNDAFNLAALKQGFPGIGCLPGSRLEPQFTAPNPVNAKDIVAFDASESTVTLDAGTGFDAKGKQFKTFPTYTWDFGDGTHTTSVYPPGASQVDEPSVFHSYQYGGTYEVTLTITDVGGNTATTQRAIMVDGPPAPAPASPAASGGVSASAIAPVTGSSTGSVAATPTVTESVLSKSLKKVAHLGLAIHYNVNDQVAGRAEALLDSATAARLGIKGRTATGLPSGYARSIVVGSAVLVTTKAGQGTIRIRFSKTIAARLAKAGQVKLTLRFVLRSASRTGVRTTTLLSTVVLNH